MEEWFTREVLSQKSNKSNEIVNRIESDQDFSFNCRKTIADQKAINLNNVLLFNSLDEIIAILLEATCQSEIDSIMIAPPCRKNLLNISTQLNIYQVKAPLTENFDLDLDMIFGAVDGSTKVIFLASPNYPTGNLMDSRSVRYVLNGFPHKLVVLDESNIEFSDSSSFINEIENHKNLIVMQSFSYKRGEKTSTFGVLYANNQTIELMHYMKIKKEIPIPNYQEISNSLQSTKLILKYITEVSRQREELVQNLENLSFVEKVFKSNTGYVFVKFSKSEEILNYLLKNGAEVDSYVNGIRSNDCICIPVSEGFKVIQLLDNLEKGIIST